MNKLMITKIRTIKDGRIELTCKQNVEGAPSNKEARNPLDVMLNPYNNKETVGFYPADKDALLAMMPAIADEIMSAPSGNWKDVAPLDNPVEAPEFTFNDIKYNWFIQITETTDVTKVDVNHDIKRHGSKTGSDGQGLILKSGDDPIYRVVDVVAGESAPKHTFIQHDNC